MTRYRAIIQDVKQISIQALKSGLSAAVAEAEAGGTILITRHNETVAQLGPARPQHLHRSETTGDGRLRPALSRATRGRYLTILMDDRGDR
jgi:antitoxin (DNA-binding transcriptional repressor) of toxin-antitoxin stability system